MASNLPKTSLATNPSEISDSGMYTDSEHSDSDYHRASVAVASLPSDTTTVNPTSPTTQTNPNYTNTFQPQHNSNQQSYPQNPQQRFQMMQQMQQQSQSLMQMNQYQNNMNNYYQSPYMMTQMQYQSTSLRNINNINTNINATTINIPPPPTTPPPPSTQANPNEKKGFWKKRKKKSSKKKKVKNKSNKSKPKTPPPVPSNIKNQIVFHPTEIEENAYISALPRPPAYTYAMSDEEEEVYKPQHESKNKSKRENAIAELIGTEVTYVSQLEKLIKLYSDKLEDNEKIISNKDWKQMFPSSLKTILNLNSQLLKDLQEREKKYNGNDEQLIISDILVGFAPYFKMYQSYINNSNIQLQIVTKCLKNKQFYNFQQKQRKQFNNLTLIDLIILPIQRIPRYKLLVNEIFKHTNKTHIDYNGLENALKLIEKINIENNEKLNDLDARTKVLNICNEMEKAPNLSSASRRFIYSNELYKIKINGKIEKYIFYLFNDCIIYGQPSTFGKKCIFKMRIPIDAAFGVQKIRNINKYKNMFIIYSSIESFMCTTKDNKQLKFKWLKKLISIISIARNNHYFHANLQHARVGRGSILIKQAQLQIPKQLKKELNKELSILNMPQTLNPKKGEFRQRYNTKNQMELLTEMEQKMQVLPQRNIGRARRKNNNIWNNFDDKFEVTTPDLNELSDDEKEFFMPKKNKKIQTLNISQSVRTLPGLNDNRKKSGTPPPKIIKSKSNDKRRRSSYSGKENISMKSIKDNQLTEKNVAKKTNVQKQFPPPPPTINNKTEQPEMKTNNENNQTKKLPPPPPAEDVMDENVIDENKKNILPPSSTSSLLQSNSSDIVEKTNYAKVNKVNAKVENKNKKKKVSVKKNNNEITKKNENKKVISPKKNNIISKSKTFTAMNDNKYGKTKSKGANDALNVIKRNRFKAFEENENNDKWNDNNKVKVVVPGKSKKKVVSKVSKPYTGDVTIWNLYIDEHDGNEPTNEWLFHKWIKGNKNVKTISFKQAREMFKGCKGRGKI